MTRSILITGATSGIGKALAFEMAKRGYSLALTGRRGEALEQIKTEIEKQYPHQKVETRALDITDYSNVPVVIRELADKLGGLDIVFANAGIAHSGKVGRGELDQAFQNIDVNLKGAMATVDAAVACFLEKGKGHIVGTSSVAAFRGLRNNSAYCASKAGFATYLEALRVEMHKKNIAVTVLYPGYIDTPLNDMMSNRPFLISAEKGAAIIAKLIERKAKSKTVPVFPWNIVGRLFKILPTGIMAKM